MTLREKLKAKHIALEKEGKKVICLAICCTNFIAATLVLAFWEQENSVSIHSQSELFNGSQGIAVSGLCRVHFGQKVYEGVIAAIGNNI